MNKHIFTFLVLVTAINTLFSQETNYGTDLSEIRKNKNQIDIDIKNIFRSLENATLIYKRAYQSGKLVDVNAIKLLRISGQINNQITFTDDPSRKPHDTSKVVYFPSNILDIQLGLGLEWQKMNKHFVHYYGVDAVFNYLKLDDDYSNAIFGGVINNATSTTDRLVRTFRTGLTPFFGIKFYFTSRISAGIETGISILYFNQSITEVNFEQQIINGQTVQMYVEHVPQISKGIQTNFNNLRFLTIGYTF